MHLLNRLRTGGNEKKTPGEKTQRKRVQVKEKHEEFLCKVFWRETILKLSFIFPTAKEDLMISRWTQTEKWETHICSFAPRSDIFSHIFLPLFFFCVNFLSLLSICVSRKWINLSFLLFMLLLSHREWGVFWGGFFWSLFRDTGNLPCMLLPNELTPPLFLRREIVLFLSTAVYSKATRARERKKFHNNPLKFAFFSCDSLFCATHKPPACIINLHTWTAMEYTQSHSYLIWH